MKKYICFLVFFILILSSCNSPEAPITPPPHVPAANIVLDGDLTIGMTDYDCPKFEGYVKNIGDNIGYNCMVEIKVYSEIEKITIIDTAKGFPADLGDIAPGQRAWFDAICFNLNSISQIVAYDVKITWLDR